jgi:outer membrane protein OmpA-like peptidoglycan-associated protein
MIRAVHLGSGMMLRGKQWARRVCAAWLLSSAPAAAQSLDTLHLSGGAYDDQGTFQLASPFLGAPDGWYLGVTASYADDPVVVALDDGSEQDLLQVQLGTRVSGGYTVLGKVRFDVEAPLYPYVQLLDSSSRAIGDLRISATVPIYDHGPSGTGVALTPHVTAPTGTPGLYVSDDGFTGGLTGVVGGSVLGLGWAANLGLEYAPQGAVGDVAQGWNVNGGAGVHYRFNDLALAGAEVDAIGTLTGGLGPYNGNPVEGHVYGTLMHRSGLRVTAAAGTGIVAGVGAPDWRVVFGLAWGDPGTPPDLDGDGMADVDDRCPDQPEDLDGFEDWDGCPEADNDQDGILDPEDGCPTDPEDFDDFDDVDGCPDPDNDFDGLLDADDVCPDDAGPLETWGCPDRDGDTVIDPEDECPDDPGDPDLGGCPDRDGDQVPDFRDACPDQPADPRVDPRYSDGCPARVMVGLRQIHFHERIFFGFNRSNIRTESQDLLFVIGETILRYPEIKSIEVGGNTDWVGSDAYNLRLSWQRSRSVIDFLEDRVGVPQGILVPQGYGESRPIDSNETEAGRGANRRVEFTILEQEEVEVELDPVPDERGPLEPGEDEEPSSSDP